MALDRGVAHEQLGGNLCVRLPAELPSWAEAVSPYLPTRLWGEVTWAAVQGRTSSLADWAGLLAYGLGFAALALWGYRRDEGAS